MSDRPRDLDWGDVVLFSDGAEPISPAARKLSGLEPLNPPPGKRWVDVLDVELDYHALVDAYLARHEHAHTPNVGAYWTKAVELLEQLFGFSLDAPAVSPSLQSRLAALSDDHPSGSRRVSSSTSAELIARDVPAERIAQELQMAAYAAIAVHARVVSPFVVHSEGLPHPVVHTVERAHRPAFDALDEMTYGHVTSRKSRKSHMTEPRGGVP